MLDVIFGYVFLKIATEGGISRENRKLTTVKRSSTIACTQPIILKYIKLCNSFNMTPKGKYFIKTFVGNFTVYNFLHEEFLDIHARF